MRCTVSPVLRRRIELLLAVRSNGRRCLQWSLLGVLHHGLRDLAGLIRVVLSVVFVRKCAVRAECHKHRDVGRRSCEESIHCRAVVSLLFLTPREAHVVYFGSWKSLRIGECLSCTIEWRGRIKESVFLLAILGFCWMLRREWSTGHEIGG